MILGITYNIFIGLAMILGTFAFQAYAQDALMRLVTPFLKGPQDNPRHKHRQSQATVLLMTSLGVICILSAEIWAWTFLYLALDIPAIPDLEAALYFSMVSFSTVGYGDIVLPPYVRLLGTMQSTSGMVLFGWSAVFMFEVLSIVYRHKPNIYR